MSKSSKTLPRTAPPPEPSAPAASLEELAVKTAAAANAPASDAAPAPEMPAEPVVPGEGAQISERTHVTLTFPLPDGIPATVLKSAMLVVRAKQARGRRRAGHSFTREETLLPMIDLRDEQLTLLAADAELVLALRIPPPF